MDKAYTVKNNAEVKYESGKSYEDEKTTDVTTNMISKTGQTGAKINYKDKTIDWEITFNTNGYEGITGVTMTDTFEEGKYLKMYKDDFVKLNKAHLTTESGGENNDNGFNLELLEPQNTDSREYTLKGFKLTLTDEEKIDAPVKFKYPTTFDPTEKYKDDKVKNTINVNWTKNTTEYENSTSFTSKFNKFTINNGDKQGIYNPIDKSIDWYVDINYNKHKLENAKVVDEFGDKQTMDAISKENIEVYALTLSDGDDKPIEEGKFEDYEVTPLDGETENYTGFILTFNENITEPYRIKYRTEYKEKFIGDFSDSNGKAKNTATLYNTKNDTDNEISKIEKEIDIKNQGKYMNKDGRDIKDTDYLEWTLKVNESQSYVKLGSKITDRLNDGQALVDDFTGLTEGDLDNKIILPRETFQVKKVEWEEDGDGFKKTVKLLEQEEMEKLFNIDIDDGKTGFTITLKEDINHEYEISYITDISASVGQSLTNTYSYNFLGEGIKKGEVTENEIVTYQFSGASGDLRRYNLKLIKKDGNDTLEGVKFGLYNKTGATLIKEVRSDSSGEVDFGSIKWGDYKLKETEPLDGYTNYFKVGDMEESVLEYTLKTTGKNTEIKLDIFNEKPSKIIIDKYAWNEDHNEDKTSKLQGAKFEVRKGDMVVDTITTDINGAGSSIDLPPGKYTLTEIQAPDKYAKITTPIEVTLTSGENQTKSIANKLLKQAVELIKVDKDKDEVGNDIPLKGAVFKLYKGIYPNGLEINTNLAGEPITEKDLTTNINGELLINNLEHGDYYFMEVKAPKYYLLPEKEEDRKHEFNIEENQTTVTTLPDIANERGNGSIKVTKLDKVNNTTFLKDVEFTLRKASDSTFEEVYSTDSNGVVEFDNLPYDTYTLVETKAHPDYLIDTNPIEIVLDGEGINSVIVEKTIENVKKDRSVRLTKYNTGKNRKLEGAIFELQKEIDGKYEVVEGYEELKTNSNGEIILGDLEVGKYRFIETESPTGYRLDTSPVEFEIRANQNETIEVEKTNTRRPSGGGGGTPPPTDPRPDPEDPIDPPKEDPKDPEEPDTPEDPETEDPTDPSEPGTQDPEDPDEPEDPEDPEDPEEPLIPIVLDPPTKGNVTINEDGSWTYTPEPGATGKDSFIITHPDGREELIEIDLDDLPLGTTSVKDGQPIISKVEEKKDDQPLLPKTGDKGKLGFYMAGMILIGLGVFLKRKRTA